MDGPLCPVVPPGMRCVEMIFNTTQTRREGEAIMAWFLRRYRKGCSMPLTMRKWAYFGVQSSDMRVSERIYCRPPNSRPVPSIVDHNESAPEFSASANAGGNHMEEGTGNYLFQGGMGENVEPRDVQSTALPHGNSYELGPGAMLLRILINGRLQVGCRSTPRQRLPLERRGIRAKVCPGGMRTESMIS